MPAGGWIAVVEQVQATLVLGGGLPDCVGGTGQRRDAAEKAPIGSCEYGTGPKPFQPLRRN